jgi:iron complex transport system ATP-binding protein
VAEILILDEPTSALDLKNQILILDWISRLSQDDRLTIMMTTHHPHHALADAVLLMQSQSSFICGAADEVLTEENLRELDGVDLKRMRFDYRGNTRETLVPVLRSGRDHFSDGSWRTQSRSDS